MIWGAFESRGTLPLAFVSKKMNSQEYQEMLETQLIPYWQPEYLFQQDNASIHGSASTMEFLLNNGVQVMEWPACSPDLNPIENLWGILVRNVYCDNKQYETVEELKSAVLRAWSNVDGDCLGRLVESVPRRLIEVIKARGGQTHY